MRVIPVSLANKQRWNCRHANYHVYFSLLLAGHSFPCFSFLTFSFPFSRKNTAYTFFVAHGGLYTVIISRWGVPCFFSSSLLSRFRREEIITVQRGGWQSGSYKGERKAKKCKRGMHTAKTYRNAVGNRRELSRFRLHRRVGYYFMVNAIESLLGL